MKNFGAVRIYVFVWFSESCCSDCKSIWLRDRSKSQNWEIISDRTEEKTKEKEEEKESEIDRENENENERERKREREREKDRERMRRVCIYNYNAIVTLFWHIFDLNCEK